jgi:polyphenol oxidase
MMLERVQAENGVVFYRSPALRAIGVPHAFSTRLGGISAAPFDSLNLGNPNGCDIQDDYDNVWANYARLQEAIGIGGRRLLRVHQVHGDIVADARRGCAFSTEMKADAIVTDDPGVVTSVRVADCVPILLARRDGSAVAAVHAGWRGVIAGIVLRAVDQLGGGAQVVAAIGPCIGFDAFEVGPEVLLAFEQQFSPAPIRRRDDGKGHVDLRAAVRQQLLGAGVAEDAIETTDRCTVRDREEFFSHRRDNGITGRLAALIGVR